MSDTAKILSRKHVVRCDRDGRENSIIDNIFVTVPNINVMDANKSPIIFVMYNVVDVL